MLRYFLLVTRKKDFGKLSLTNHFIFNYLLGTLFGRYKWLRMHFGISSAPEEFQHRHHEVLENLNGVEVIADDILVYGRGETYEEALADRDKNLEALLQ